ncbi:MAG: hypothetical protein QOF63_1099 [Thermoanaerobaculia bacterium]|jgi:hypothetical protein|nr:hypothetical protein [Thermoanaerobaculia bacterium]
MRIFAAILLGIFAVAISVFYSAGAFAPPAPPPPILVIHRPGLFALRSGQAITLTAHSTQGYRFTPWSSPITSGDQIEWSKDCASYLSYIYIGPDKDQHDLATRIERLQAERLALPPLPISDSVERDHLKKRYGDIDKRIKRLQDLRDNVRTILSQEDLLVHMDSSKENSRTKTATGPSEIATQHLADHAQAPSSAALGARRGPAVVPIMMDRSKKQLTIFTYVTDSTRRFFDYLLAHPHDALDDFLLAFFYYLVLVLGIITGTIYDALVVCKRAIGTNKLLFSTAWECWNWKLPIGKS